MGLVFVVEALLGSRSGCATRAIMREHQHEGGLDRVGRRGGDSSLSKCSQEMRQELRVVLDAGVYARSQNPLRAPCLR